MAVDAAALAGAEDHLVEAECRDPELTTQRDEAVGDSGSRRVTLTPVSTAQTIGTGVPVELVETLSAVLYVGRPAGTRLGSHAGAGRGRPGDLRGLDAARANAVVVCHALTGDAHAAGHHGNQARRGWWDNIIGPGRPLDTDRFFVVCANLIGGCQGIRANRRPTRDRAALRPALSRSSRSATWCACSGRSFATWASSGRSPASAGRSAPCRPSSGRWTPPTSSGRRS